MFEWDETKNQENLSKHGLSFEDARCDYGEERFITLGLLSRRVVVIAHTPRGERTRVISMRKANSREQKTYQERLKTD